MVTRNTGMFSGLKAQTFHTTRINPREMGGRVPDIVRGSLSKYITPRYGKIALQRAKQPHAETRDL